MGSFTKAASAKEAIFFTDSIEVAKTYAVPKNLDETKKGRELLNEFDISKITPEEDAQYGLIKIYKDQISDYEDDFDFDTVSFRRGLNKIKGWKTGTEYEYYSDIYPVILNVKNPKIKDFESKGYRDESYFELQIKAKEANNDGTILKNTFDGRERWGVFESNIYTVFEPEQIHILGSKQDIEGFKNWFKTNTKIVRKGAITPSIKGHAQFATDNGIGWFRSDEQTEKNTQQKEEYIEYDTEDGETLIPITKQEYRGGKPTKTRRILEIQSDLFQKGRDRDNLVNIDATNYITTKRKELSFLEFNKQINDLKLTPEYGPGGVSYENDNFYFYTEDYNLENDGSKYFVAYKSPTKKVDASQNQFLQLLNKNNNWVTFFIKSIIQDSAKKGYEKVLFPTGNTASKIEGHDTLEEFKKQKEDRIKKLEENKIKRIYEQSSVYRKNDAKILKVSSGNGNLKDGFAIWKDDLEQLKDKTSLTGEEGENATGVKFLYIKDSVAKPIFEEDINREINQLKQELERLEREGFGALKPIYNFYETTITNILKKQGYNPVLITDEYGNTWSEVTIDSKRDLTNIMLQIPGSYNSTQITSELYSTLVEFAKKLNPNFEINVLDDLLENRGVNGVARIKEFIIDLQRGKESALAEEAAHFFVELLPEDHSLKQALYSEVPHTKLYKKVVQDYRAVYGNDTKRLQRETMAKLVSLYLTDKEMFNYWSGSPSLVDTLLKWIKTFFQWIKGKSDPFILAANKITGLDTTDLKIENATLADDMFSLAEFMNKTQVLESVGNTYIKPYDKIFINLNDTILDYQGYKGSAKEKRDFLFDERKINERNEFFKTANLTSLGKELEDKIQFIGPDKIVFFTQMPVNEVLRERLAHLGKVERINIPQVVINEETGEVIKEYETNSLQELMEGSEKPLVIDNSVKTLNIPHTFKRFNSRKSSYVNLKTRLDREEQRKQREEKERDFVGEMKLIEQSEVIQKVKKAFDILKKELGDTKRTEYILEQMGESNSLFKDAYGNITLPLNLAKNASNLVDEANNYEKALIQYLMTIEATTKFFKNLNNSKFQSTRDLIEKGSEENLEKAIQELYAISKMGTDWQEYIRSFRKLTKDLPHTSTMDSVFGELDTQITRTKALALDLSNQVIGEKLKDQFESYNATINSQIEDFTSRLDKSEGVEKQRLEKRIAELKSLLKTPEDLFKILIGESKDIDNLTVWVKTLHNSGDPLIGSIGRLMQKAFAEVETSVLQRAQDFGQRVTELKQQFNITDKDIEEQLVTVGTTRIFNSETGEFEIKERLEVLNPFQNLHEYDVKKEEVDKLRLKWKQSESEETKKAYFDTKREFESWLNSNWHQEFTPEYYSRYTSLLTTPEEQELFEEVKQDQINIYDQINDIVSTMEVDNILAKKESLKKIQTLRQELKGMKRDVYFDGTPKVGKDLEKAKMLQRKSEIDREIYEYQPNYQKFRTEFTILLNTMDIEEDVYQTLMSLVNKESFSELYQYAKENAPFEILDWLNDNTVTRFTQEWYDERAQLSEGISQLTNEINELQGVTTLDLKEEWESLMNLASPLRDEDNILDGSVSTPEIQKKVLSYEQKIEDAKRAAREEAKGVYSIEIKEKKKTLTELIKKLQSIQSKSTTDAYNEQFVTIARESGFLEKFNSKYPGLQIEENSNLNAVINTLEFRSFVENENDEFTKWFKDNHFLKSSIVDGNEVFNWSPTYIWMKIEPIESKNILMVPSMQYSIRQVKPEFKTEKVDWVTWNPINKKWLPKSQTYFNQAYLKLMQGSNEGLKQILKEITEYHLETQSDPYTPREAKIGFGLPSVAKRDLETGEYFKNMFQNFIQKENRFEEGEGNYSETEGEKKSLKQRFISWLNGVTGKEEPSENSTDNVARYTRIAVPYSHYMEPERVSKDILLTTIMFAGSTAKSQRMLKESKLFRLIEDSLQSTSLQLDQRGRPVDTNKNRYKAFRFYLDHHVYGMNKQYELGKYGKQIDQTLTRVRKLNTIGTLGLPFGFANTLKNNLQGRLQNIIGNQFANWSSPSSMRKASLNLGTNFFKFMSEIERDPKDRSLDYYILTFFNPHHLKLGELILKGGSKRLLQERHIYLFNEGMEFSISANLLYGHLYHKKVKGENGEVKTLYEILEKKDSKLSIKPGFVDYRTGKPIDMDYMMNLKLGYHTVLEYTQGKVDSKTLLSTYTIGQTLLYFKNWMIPMLRRRFDKSRPNYMVGEEIEGYWRTFGRLSYQMLKDFVQHGKLYWNTYTEEEKRNYMTTLNEIVFVIGSSILISLVFGFDADDPDKFKKLKDNSYAENLALLMVLQAKSETETLSMMPFFNVESQVIPPVFTETLRLVKNPTTGFAAAEDLSKMIDATYGLVLGKENAYYQKNIPQFNIEKGDSKLEHYFTKFIQYDNWLYATENPEGRIQSFIAMIKR